MFIVIDLSWKKCWLGNYFFKVVFYQFIACLQSVWPIFGHIGSNILNKSVNNKNLLSTSIKCLQDLTLICISTFLNCQRLLLLIRHFRTDVYFVEALMNCLFWLLHGQFCKLMRLSPPAGETLRAFFLNSLSNERIFAVVRVKLLWIVIYCFLKLLHTHSVSDVLKVIECYCLKFEINSFTCQSRNNLTD